jgi:hypothetical protein
MNFNSHHTITELVCEKLKLSDLIGDANVQDAIKYSSFPDYANDIWFRLVGEGKKKRSSIFGHSLAAFTHFGRVTTPGHYMGYCFNKDGSITKFEKPNIFEISVDDTDWRKQIFNVKDNKKITKHPVQQLLDVPGYTHEGLEFTYSTSAIMAEYTAKNYDKSYWWRAASIVGHLACDACVRDHNWCTILGGHSNYEGDIDEHLPIIEGIWKDVEKLDYPQPIKSLREPRRIVEDQCEITGAWSGRPDPEWALKYGIWRTIESFKWFMEDIKK